MRAIASRLAGGVVFFAAELAASAAHPEATVAVYWQPPRDTPTSVAARAAFRDAAASIGARFVDATPAEATVASLAPALEAGKAAYEKFAFRDAIAAFDNLQRAADAAGGGDLDGRQLSEIFLYRGLAKLETTSADAAWDDLVNAARLEPTRVLDPARFQPRAVATYKRAAAEAAQLPRAELALDVPTDAVVHIDGALAELAAGITLGHHFITVVADGYERWAAAVSISSTPARLKPPLHPYRLPPLDKLVSLAGDPPPNRLLVGVLEKAPGGWTFTARDIALSDGRTVSDTVALRDVPTRAAIFGLVQRLRPPAPTPRARWVPWVIGACAALLVTSVVAAAMNDPSPNVVGELGHWR